jgi:hypothetical protein
LTVALLPSMRVQTTDALHVSAAGSVTRTMLPRAKHARLQGTATLLSPNAPPVLQASTTPQAV